MDINPHNAEITMETKRVKIDINPHNAEITMEIKKGWNGH